MGFFFLLPRCALCKGRDLTLFIFLPSQCFVFNEKKIKYGPNLIHSPCVSWHDVQNIAEVMLPTGLHSPETALGLE